MTSSDSEFKLDIFPSGRTLWWIFVAVGAPLFFGAFLVAGKIEIFYLLPAALLFLGPPAVLVTWIVLALLEGVAVIGQEGVLARYRHRRHRFFPYSEMDGAPRTIENRVAFFVNGKQVLRLRPTPDSVLLVDAVATAVHLAKVTNEQLPPLDMLPPADLGRASLGAGSYRVATPSRDELWAIVENVATAREPRIVAAQAIAATFVTGERARLAEAARVTEDPRIRMALEDAMTEGAGVDDVEPRQVMKE